MATPSTVMVLERCLVSPPPASAPPTSLPLTFFDIPWLLFSPSQPLFFYHFPYSTAHFTSTALPNLKHSLSLTLQLFYPLAGNLTSPPLPGGKPQIIYSQGDSVSFTVAESNADFNHLSGNHPRDVNEFYSLVPHLPLHDKHVLPLLAVQITVFRDSGICIGLAFHHVVADGRTFNLFMKSWASMCRFGGDSSDSVESLPFYDRTVINDPNGLEPVLLKEWWKRKSMQKDGIIGTKNGVVLTDNSTVRATFVMDPTHIERIKQWIFGYCMKRNRSPPILLSPYVVTCALVWVYLIKARGCKNEKVINGEDLNYFGFIAGGIHRLDYPVPAAYFGNCVAFGRSAATRSELMGEDGILVAAEAIGNTVKKLDKAVLGGAEKWISEWEVLCGSEVHVTASGSPKLDLYEIDFGWGKPRKIEEISIDSMRAISLTQSRDMEGGIEVGLALPKPSMDAFTSLFNNSLKLGSS